ncbi:CoA-binding protein [uncultured Helicobacter sp.]|uniref:CoA-binding protein n=1 Tax=uncultured Helicobacter sp. TaxID=175537 RepID=UPI0025D8F6DF|nr:CoA-binding protein [uncultured Helicobacter sp.]
MRLSDTQKKEILQKAKVIVIIGLSPDSNKPSYQVGEFLLKKGYDIVPIYPKGGEILGKQAYPTLQKAFEALAQKGVKCDIINVFRKSEALGEIMREILSLQNLGSFDLNHLCVWVQLGLHNTESANLAKEHHIAYEEDSCIKLEYLRVVES